MKPFTPILLLLFLLVSNLGTAQTIDISNTPKDKWILYKDGVVKVYYKVQECTNHVSWKQERVLFKFTNTSQREKELSFIPTLIYDNWNNSNSDNETVSIKLKGGETKESKDLPTEINNEFSIFVKSLDDRVQIKTFLSSFTLTNLQSHDL